jgi:hypothetical protein
LECIRQTHEDKTIEQPSGRVWGGVELIRLYIRSLDVGNRTGERCHSALTALELRSTL